MTNAEATKGRDDGGHAEDAERAGLYAIIGRFFYHAPDESLLAAIADGARDDAGADGPMSVAWGELCEACRSVSPAELGQEFETLFHGVGKSEVTPYTSHYVKEGAPGRHLVRLRRLLAEWGLGRRDAATETEDHVAGICDVMRLLVSEDYPLEQQQLFFNDFMYPTMIPFCDAIDRSPNAAFFRRVAQFTRTFLAVEKAAFEMQ